MLEPQPTHFCQHFLGHPRNVTLIQTKRSASSCMCMHPGWSLISGLPSLFNSHLVIFVNVQELLQGQCVRLVFSLIRCHEFLFLSVPAFIHNRASMYGNLSLNTGTITRPFSMVTHSHNSFTRLNCQNYVMASANWFICPFSVWCRAVQSWWKLQ